MYKLYLNYKENVQLWCWWSPAISHSCFDVVCYQNILCVLFNRHQKHNVVYYLSKVIFFFKVKERFVST